MAGDARKLYNLSQLAPNFSLISAPYFFSPQVDTGLTPPPVDDDFEGSQQYYATINGTHTKIIATIDEKNFDPDANFYPDLGTNLNLNPLYRAGPAISPTVGSRSGGEQQHTSSFR